MLDPVRNLIADFDVAFDENIQTSTGSQPSGSVQSSRRLEASREDLRGSRTAVPRGVYYYLNEVQRIALHSLEHFGWQLAFIRRPLFVAPLVVVKNQEKARFAVLEEDGSVNLSPLAKWRH